MTLDATITVNETIRRFPGTVSVFNSLGVDSCCGGEATLREAAVKAGTDENAMLAALAAATDGPAADKEVTSCSCGCSCQ